MSNKTDIEDVKRILDDLEAGNIDSLRAKAVEIAERDLDTLLTSFRRDVKRHTDEGITKSREFELSSLASVWTRRLMKDQDDPTSLARYGWLLALMLYRLGHSNETAPNEHID